LYGVLLSYCIVLYWITEGISKKSVITLHRLYWFEHVQRMEFLRVLYMNLESTKLRGRPRYRLQAEVREDGRIVGEEWQENAYNREEWKMILRIARNHTLHMTME
jgi:hypothetical protein